MINILLGAPGGGKSYEAVVYQILPALARGRKVVTNLPLNIEELRNIDAGYPALIELREKTLAVRPSAGGGGGDDETPTGLMGLIRSAQATRFIDRAFGNIEDYQADWKSPDGTGVLYVIDECHFVLGKGSTSRAIEEWFSMHRHFNVDVLLITQSAGKISLSIKDLVQICYKVRKATALGASNKYIRKVLDGVNGGETSVTEREYKPQFFKLYRSHTQGVAALEQGADDVAPLIVKFRRFSRVFYVVTGIAIVYAFWPAPDKPKPTLAKGPSPSLSLVSNQPLPPALSASAAASAPGVPLVAAVPVEPSGPPEPFASKKLHLTGVIVMGTKTVHTFAISSNGQRIGSISDAELRGVGYKWQPQTECIGILTWAGKPVAITCDGPTVAEGSRRDPVVLGLPAGSYASISSNPHR